VLNHIPVLGVGLSFRKELKQGILAEPSRVDFLELIADQYVDKPLFREREAQQLAQKFPLVVHGVDLSIGTDCPPDSEYLAKTRRFADLIGAQWVSDHLSFTRVPGSRLGQLTPIPFNQEMASLVIEHLKRVQGEFDQPFLIENISYYFVVPPSTMSEAEFLTAVVQKSGCFLLLDLTNLLNNSINHNYDPFEFLDRIPLDRVVQIHLAGSTFTSKLWVDSHSRPVPPDVFELLKYAAPRMSQLKGVNIERDQDFPPIEELFAELDRTREILKPYCKPRTFPSALQAGLSGQ
jgi:uncharacterized protein